MIAEIIARLDGTAPLKLVDGAIAFDAAAKSKPKALPAAFVIPLSEVGQASPTYGRTRQRVRLTFGVVYAVSNVADAKGAAAQADLKTVRDAGLVRLLGWSPTGADAVEFDQGRLLAFKDGVLWWQDAFRTQTAISSS